MVFAHCIPKCVSLLGDLALLFCDEGLWNQLELRGTVSQEIPQENE